MDDRHRLQVFDVCDRITCIGDPVGTLGRSNSVILTTADSSSSGSAFIVDTLLTPSLANTVSRHLAERELPASVVLNTHSHIDHVGGNAEFRHARIVASPPTVSMVAQMVHDTGFLAERFPAFAAELSELTVRVPVPIDPDRDLPAGVELLTAGPAHSPGDVALWLPDERILVAGDLCFGGVIPLALPGHANLEGWATALARLDELGPRIVIPGHGQPGGPAMLAALRRYLDALLDVAGDVARDRIDVDAALATLRSALPGWAEPAGHAVNLRTAMASLSPGAPRGLGTLGRPLDSSRPVVGMSPAASHPVGQDVVADGRKTGPQVLTEEPGVVPEEVAIPGPRTAKEGSA